MSRLSLGLLLGLAGLGPLSLPAFAAGPPSVVTKQSIVQGNNRFALDLYARLRAEKGNLFFSPLSLSAGLAMTSAGAAGDTLREMEKVLYFPGQETLHPAFASLVQDLTMDRKPGCQVRIANALWGQAGYPFRPEFMAQLNKEYAAGFHTVDFAKQRDHAVKTINSWVQTQTQNQIKELLKPALLADDTRMVLTNAICFKGDWAHPFRKEATHQGPFTRADGASTPTTLMTQHGTFGYRWFSDVKVQALEMPYAGKHLSMVVLLPEKADGLPALEKILTPANLTKWLEKLHVQPVIVTMPRFQMTWEKELPDALKEMGMPLAFGLQADFSRATSSREGLLLSRVIHKAFVDVGEEGTTAAASTGITATSRGIDPTFKANQPFVFLIRDRKTGSILFLGRMVAPQG